MDSAVATVSVTVNSVQDPPVVSNSSLTTNEDIPNSGTLVGTDAEGDPLTYSIVANGSIGTVVIDNPATGAFTYTPNLNANGVDSFTFKANDGFSDSNIATVAVTVNAVNDLPVISTISAQSTDEDVPVLVNFTVTDVDSPFICNGDYLSTTSSDPTIIAGGSTVYGGTYPNCTATFLPNPNQNGLVTITLYADDWQNVASTSFNLNINPIEDSPTISSIFNVNATMNTAEPVSFLIEDPDSALTCLGSIFADSSDVTLVPLANIVFSGTYPNCTAVVTPTTSMTGSSTLTFTVSDGVLSASSSFDFNVSASVPPTLSQSHYRVYQSQSSLTLSSPIGNEDMRNGGIASGQAIRIRMGVDVSTSALTAASKSFRLQFGTPGAGTAAGTCSSITTWTDVGAIGSATIWRFYDEPSLASGSSLPSQVLSASTIAASYNESDTAANPAALIGDQLEYDWSLQNNGASPGTYYCFRMIVNDLTLLNSYLFYPRIGTKVDGTTWEMHTPATSLSAIDPTPTSNDSELTGVTNGQLIFLRQHFRDMGQSASGSTVRLKYYTNFTDFANDTNGRYVVAPGTATASDDLEWAGTAACSAADWCDHGKSVAPVTTFHAPYAGLAFEKEVKQGDPVLFDFTSPGPSGGPEFVYVLRYVGSALNQKYFVRIEVDGGLLSVSPMHWGATKPAHFSTAP